MSSAHSTANFDTNPEPISLFRIVIIMAVDDIICHDIVLIKRQ